MGRRKDAVVTEASVTPIRTVIPLAALAIWDPKPYLSLSGWSCGVGSNTIDAIDVIMACSLLVWVRRCGRDWGRQLVLLRSDPGISFSLK